MKHLRVSWDVLYNKMSSDSQDKDLKPSKMSRLCGHFMQVWDNHKVCFKCREMGKGEDPSVHLFRRIKKGNYTS